MPNPGEESLYDVLGVHKFATPDEIKKAYRKLALKHHPDKNPGDDSAAERFKKINHANVTLMNPVKRQFYDRYGSLGVDIVDQLGEESAVTFLKMDNWCVKGLFLFCGLITGCYFCCCCCCCCGKCKAPAEEYEDGGVFDDGDEADVINKQPTTSYHSCADDGKVPPSGFEPSSETSGLLGKD